MSPGHRTVINAINVYESVCCLVCNIVCMFSILFHFLHTLKLQHVLKQMHKRAKLCVVIRLT